jgi:hypothetical protein
MVRHFRVPGALRTKLEELGVNVSAVLRTAGLPKDLFNQMRILVSTEEQFALWRAIGDVGKDPSIGLKLGAESKTERFIPWKSLHCRRRALVQPFATWPVTRG